MVSNEGAPGTVLVTGCAGFLGSHFTDRFLAAGWSVIGIDNLMSGSRRNLSAALQSDRFRFREADIIEPFDFKADLVLNLACPASPPRYQADPIHTMKTSVFGVLNIAERAADCRARFVHASTSEIYGDPTVHPQPETYRGAVNPIGPRACYDEGKRAAETILFDLARTRGLDIGVCRIFNTYGPRMDPYDGRVVSNLLRSALMGEPLTIYGDGTQTRSFCYVDDLIEGIWRLCHAGSGVTGPINIGNPNEITILELVDAITDLVGGRLAVEYRPLPSDDPLRRRPDISLAQDQLGWEPVVPLKEGLVRTLEFYEGIISSGAIHDYADRARYRAAAE